MPPSPARPARSPSTIVSRPAARATPPVGSRAAAHRLPGTAQDLPALLERARRENLSVLAVVSAMADAEKASRIKSAINRRIRDARFPEVNTVDGFDFDPVRRKLRGRYLALLDLAFLERGANPIFIGTPGTGKTWRRVERATTSPVPAPDAHGAR